MQRVAWNDAVDMCTGSARRGSRNSEQSALHGGPEYESISEVHEFRRSTDSALSGQNKISQHSASPSLKKPGYGRTAAMAFIRKASIHNGGHPGVHSRRGSGKGNPLWGPDGPIEVIETQTLPELLQAQLTSVQQVLQYSNEKIIDLHSEREHKLNDLRAENKALRASQSRRGSAIATKGHQHKSGGRGSLAPSAAQSAVPSMAPSTRSSLTSMLGTIRGDWSNAFQRGSTLESVNSSVNSTTEKVSASSHVMKADKTDGLTPVTPIPPPARGLNGCANMELQDYEDGHPDTFGLTVGVTSHSIPPLLSARSEVLGLKDLEHIVGAPRFSEDGSAYEEDHFSDDGSEDSLKEMFNLYPIWTKVSSTETMTKPIGSSSANLNLNMEGFSKLRDLTFKFTDVLAEENQKSEWCASVEKLVLQPNSIKRAVWDFVSIILVAYDLVSIPLAIFEPQETGFVNLMAWVTRIFWSCDMPLSFFTGFIKSDGSMEMRPPKIAKRYVTTWFFLDFFLVTIDWMESSWSEGLGYARLGKSSRVFRVLRMVRLLRMLRMKEVIQVFMERMHSERLWIFSDIFKIMILVVGMAHIIACLWYGIGNTDSQEQTWVKEHLVAYKDLGGRYAMSFHWSLSQFTGGMDEMRPHTVGERVFAICIWIFAFTVAAVFVSSLTSSMTRLHFIASHQSKQFFQLRRYLYQNNISDELMLRIQRNAQHAVMESQVFMQEMSVELLDMVSEPLRIDLHFELYSPIYRVHPFFDRYVDDCPEVMRKVCHRATSMTLASCGDTMFDAGEIPAHPKMIFVCSGEMQYVSIGGIETQVKAVTWISEAVLWTPWMHLGVLTATSECRVIFLDSQKFHNIVAQYDHAAMNPRKYATEFIALLNSTSEEISDLPLTYNKKTFPRGPSVITSRRLTVQFNKTG